MKKILILVGGIIGLVLLIYAFDKLTSTGNQIASYDINDPNVPKIEIQEKTYDFGDINLQDVVKHEFKLKNIGKDPLIVTDLLTSCHCTTVVLKVAELVSIVYGIYWPL